jgi:DNA (cytosine-5)-methyltransferase 1
MGESYKIIFIIIFKSYKSHMRDWIKDLKPGENAFDNLDPLKRPHQIKRWYFDSQCK